MSDQTPAPERAGTAQTAQQNTSMSLNPISSGPSPPKPIQQPQGYGIGRRTHKKSRTGCATCKSRKIKTYSTLTADPSLWDFWRDDVVRLGLSRDYIMRAVLAVSALHLAYHRPDRRDFYTAQGILLHQKASRSAMRCMAAGKDMDKDEAASLFLFSMLTIFFALACPRRSQPDGSFFIGESGFPDWAFLLSGCRSLSDHVLGERGMETVAAPFLVYGRKRYLASYQAILDEKAKAGPDAKESTLLAPLRQRIAAAVSDPDLLQRYTHALDQLELALVVRQNPDTPRDVLDAMVWLWMVSETLVPLLKVPTQTQEAVAIFAHYSILLKHNESHWWLQGWGTT
ncbi:hypothetical protein MMYC01_209466 [Madurella mycetomatis]|uniref:Sterol uptake control protein 2 n=1 Tax=Madurella mycetomatis TaxID=100816 RepID=A0A175VSI3_9PEZI|nr:hypothetical protein MMYC01_209466 [Madurella mycetomatis]